MYKVAIPILTVTYYCACVCLISDLFAHYSGSFERCEICAYAEDLEKQCKNKSSLELDVIKTYRRRHISQQYEERRTLKRNIESTRELDENGQPVRALIFNDAMTATKGIILEVYYIKLVCNLIIYIN